MEPYNTDKVCYICLESISNEKSITLECCASLLHYDCLNDIIQSKSVNPDPGQRITLQQLSCFICRRKMKNEQIKHLFVSIDLLYDKLKKVALNKLKYNNKLHDDAVINKNGKYYNDPAGYAMKLYSFFICYKCKEPYCAGTRSCVEEFNDNNDIKPEERLCTLCEPAPGAFVDSWQMVLKCMRHCGIWLCPNDHVYFIDACVPGTNESSTCSTCGAPTGNQKGASSHTPAPGNRIIGKIDNYGKIIPINWDPYINKQVPTADVFLYFDGKSIQFQDLQSMLTPKMVENVDDGKDDEKDEFVYIPKKKGKIYSKYGVINGNHSPQIILNLTHLNKLHKLYKVNFDQKWNVFIKNNVETHLLDLAQNFDYFINGINENKNVSYSYNGLLSSKAKLGDTIIIRSKPNIPLPAKPVNIDDGEFIPSLKPIDFNNNDEEKKEVNIIKVVKHKKEINKKIIDSLLNVDNTNKKLSKLINIQSFNKEGDVNDDAEKKCNDGNNKKNNKLNLDYKLHLDLDYEKELKNKNEFLNNMKKEIAESLNVDINSIHINSVRRGSVILLITIDEKGTTEIYKDAILTSAQFGKWSINRCLKGKNIDNYYKNKNKNFNENTKMWQFLKNKFGEATYNSMKQQSINKYNNMKNAHSSLIEPLSFDQIAAIYLYTTNYLYKPLNRELRDGKSEYADFTVELICGINKLPLIWTTSYRGLGPNFTKYHSYIPNVYKKGSVIRWDGMNSTSKNKNVALGFSDKWVIEIDGYHGRDIQPFSAYTHEDEIIYIISSHFIVTNIYNENGKIFFKVREMPFPWNQKAILWVDDKPTNNKGLIERLEKKGIMIIPRISTHDALQFMCYMKNIFLDNTKFSKFRVISDMTRYEKTDENNEQSETIKNRNAGAILVNELRKQGYNQKICIYTGNKQRAIDECNKFGHTDNIKATTSTQECFEFADY